MRKSAANHIVVQPCKSCGAPRHAHRVCMSCGKYGDEQIIVKEAAAE
jgi:ribosomal protein L32